MEKIEERVKQIMAQVLVLDMKLIQDNANLMEDLGADSLDVIEIAMDIENEFRISIPDDDTDKLKTVSDFVKYVQDKKNTIIT